MTTATADTSIAAVLTDEQRAYIDGLRALADHLEAHPVLIPSGDETFHRYIPSWDDDARDQFAAAVRELGGHREKTTGDSYYNVSRQFGPHELVVYTDRAVVCEKVVVGVETVEVPDPEALAAVPKISTEREIVEWRCSSSVLGAMS